ncbi:hypothetical protein B0O99DRAFT_601071 [Bisporella sp. PMI_857]|nr:hypothetical protein B0O99DRAFT_601071 [Bisporella sp. PMI_857]
MLPFLKLSSKSTIVLDFHKITIQQVPCPEVHQDGRLQYSVKITVDDNPEPIERTFNDPCSKKDHDSCLLYLNEMLNEGRYDSAIAESTDTMINEYGKELFRQLGIRQFSRKLTRANVIIEIREADLQQDTRNTIHQIRWEQLEDQDLWPRVKARRISVRRVTSQTNATNGPAAATGETSYQKEEGRVNILLVIARSFEKNNGQYYDIDPGITMSAILRIKRALEDNKSPHSIVLEVVRPGTFDAFKKHLKARPKGYFDIVHFDVHGRVTSEVNQNCKTHKSYLHFLHEDFLKRKPEDMKDDLVGVPARAIADELHLHQVPYAVLNACKSANPFGGNDGNLSRLFSMENSLKILAMSYNISGAAIKLLCERFYRSFFKDLESFSDLAS